ncbi:hypothetical protein HBI56_090530 [Parastagonospora nodorum]|uniref:Uncharacterized protein n=1 Tax=Phaeosphaeria nodorum (strain SN15 / ATCC MYA-4574 / FGSC 10173) TaxID=321614 RepID=A0A7U2FDT4_PHANO|nr:hypothetical protein HBH56_108950 [Parastagonospora nodorum]QRD03238.1 hypothetical protein JI435_419290 [Parastagonospora nodorum SN15]KAH3922295.1 hypothetical protein HBH54_226050 [Parastagonospora nodorum]KAH3951127.1 hypothetical protein HBH53_064690 [Parastagonospora nodorum]KAH3974496.1 hypothetical protein HBH51_093590 [Parastagonospora nodorum]
MRTAHEQSHTFPSISVRPPLATNLQSTNGQRTRSTWTLALLHDASNTSQLAEAHCSRDARRCVQVMRTVAMSMFAFYTTDLGPRYARAVNGWVSAALMAHLQNIKQSPHSQFCPARKGRL